MPTNTRRPARGQTLPEDEANKLASLSPFDRHARAAYLFSNGWTLRAIGEAFDPPKPRSTVKSWVDRASTPGTPTTPVPLPAPAPAPPAPKPASPGISSHDQSEIARLAVVARKYRSGMSPLHAAALANVRLSEMCRELRSDGVTIRELASAAGVTYRAMAKRLDKQ